METNEILTCYLTREKRNGLVIKAKGSGYQSEEIKSKDDGFQNISNLWFTGKINNENALILCNELMQLDIPSILFFPGQEKLPGDDLIIKKMKGIFVNEVKNFYNSVHLQILFNSFPEVPIFILGKTKILGHFFYKKEMNHHYSDPITSQKEGYYYLDCLRNSGTLDRVEVSRAQYYWEKEKNNLPLLSVEIIIPVIKFKMR